MEEVDFACAVAELGAQAISNAKMYENRTRELNFLKGLLEVSKAINSALDVKKVLNLLVKTVTTALDIKGAGVRLLDEKRQQMELVASYGLSDRYINKGPVGTDKSITDAMMGKAVSIYDVEYDPRATYPQQAAEEGIKSILSVPINLKGNVIGVMRIYTSEPREFSDDEITFISSLAEQAALGMENARLYQKLKGEYEDSEARAKDVHKRIADVEQVAGDLFKEWEKELGQYKSAELRRTSQRQLQDTRSRYQKLIASLKRAEKKLDPVLTAFNDRVLFLKHNLNARAIASLRTNRAAIEADIGALVADMNKSIAEADQFIKAMSEAK